MKLRALTPIEGRIYDLLGDGVPRTPSEIVRALVGPGGFVAERELSRTVQTVLPALVAGERVRRLTFGTPAWARPGQFQYEARYAIASSVLPVCLTCFRNRWVTENAPPQSSGNAIQLCSLCRTRTNDAAYLPVREVEERRS